MQYGIYLDYRVIFWMRKVGLSSEVHYQTSNTSPLGGIYSDISPIFILED